MAMVRQKKWTAHRLGRPAFKSRLMPIDQAFLGTGWSFPPTFTQGGAEVALVSGAEDIQQSLQILLSTRLGERVMEDEFGCDLHSALFEEVDQSLINTLNGLITDA